MAAAARMVAGVSIRRAVAAQRGAAFLASAQMQPFISGFDALLAYALLGMLYRGDEGEMGTTLNVHHDVS